MTKHSKKELLNLKLEFLALYDLGYRARSLSSRFNINFETCKSWCYMISIFGKDVFLVADSTKMHYDYETKLAAVKAYLEDGLNRREIMAKYRILSLKVFDKWKKLYEEGGPEALMPKPRGRRPKKSKIESELSSEEKLLKRIEELEIENAIIKKVIALKCSKR